MNRQQEFWELKQQLQQLPPELDGTAQRARQRARHRRLGRGFGISLGSLAGVCAAFILAVNTMPTFALACGRVPILRELAAAVALSPSLSAAVEHDFVQYVGQTQTIGGVTVTVEYIIADQQQIVVFYRTVGPGNYRASCDLLDGNGTPLHGYSVISGDSSGDLKQFEIHCKDLDLPETLVLELSLRRITETGNSVALDGVGSFSIHLDPEKTAKAVVVPVEQWVDLDGQQLLVDRLELTPTRTLLYLDGDPANTAWLQSLDFWFTASDGTVYDQQDGMVSASGDAEHPGFYTFYFQSLYFVDHPERLTLHIAEAVWLDKSEPTVTIDLNNGVWTGSLPEGVVDIEVQQVVYGGESAAELTVSTTVDRNLHRAG
ncbi:DUF4179 domain-containing protein [Candidatus Avoscillospira sp. LCP25S3_F1]|uniref:DUF4179 domain-containing protein n=1 Tax=Candidatus Avoscillospira sp. LCP25S3_F1 TaxID=3438825 RepID=UPI003F9057B4